jgi:hypothetical protein
MAIFLNDQNKYKSQTLSLQVNEILRYRVLHGGVYRTSLKFRVIMAVWKRPCVFLVEARSVKTPNHNKMEILDFQVPLKKRKQLIITSGLVSGGK